MLVYVGKEKDSRGRWTPVYLDTDDLPDEDYVEFRRLMDAKKVMEARAFLEKRRQCYW